MRAAGGKQKSVQIVSSAIEPHFNVLDESGRYLVCGVVKESVRKLRDGRYYSLLRCYAWNGDKPMLLTQIPLYTATQKYQANAAFGTDGALYVATGPDQPAESAKFDSFYRISKDAYQKLSGMELSPVEPTGSFRGFGNDTRRAVMPARIINEVGRDEVPADVLARLTDPSSDVFPEPGEPSETGQPAAQATPAEKGFGKAYVRLLGNGELSFAQDPLLKEVKFQLYRVKNNDGKLTDDEKHGEPVSVDANGYARWESLPAGHYWAREINMPVGYVLPNGSDWVLEDGQPQKYLGELTQGDYCTGQCPVCELCVEIRNCRGPGWLVLRKTDEAGALLPDSRWRLSKPGNPTFPSRWPEEGYAVVDWSNRSQLNPCRARWQGDLARLDDNSLCVIDTDPAPGVIRLDLSAVALAQGSARSDLGWGEYQLTEVAAPLGYMLDDTLRAVLVGPGGAEAISTACGLEANITVVNRKTAGPKMPMAGGVASDHIKILGAASLAAAVLGGLFYRRRARKLATTE